MTVEIEIKVQGFHQVLEYLAGVKRKTPIATDDAAREICKEMAMTARSKVAPGNTGTGALRRSINYKRIAGSKSSANKLWAVDTSGQGILPGSPIPKNQRPQHAYYQEYGFMPHPVRVSNLSPGPLKSNLQQVGQKTITVRESTPYMSYARRKVLNRVSTITNRFIGVALMPGR